MFTLFQLLFKQGVSLCDLHSDKLADFILTELISSMYYK